MAVPLRPGRYRGLFVLVPLGYAALTACTFIADFSDPEEVEESDAATTPTATTTATATTTTTAPPQDSGKPDQQPQNRCQGKANGTQWDVSNPYARCCNNQEVSLNTKDHCGGCGFACQGAQTCALYTSATTNESYYYCVGCNAAAGGGHASCWSGCCSKSYDSNGLCAASTCSGTVSCNGAVCEPGQQCKGGDGMSYFCAYP